MYDVSITQISGNGFDTYLISGWQLMKTNDNKIRRYNLMMQPHIYLHHLTYIQNLITPLDS